MHHQPADPLRPNHLMAPGTPQCAVSRYPAHETAATTWRRASTMDDVDLLIPKSILEEFQSHCTALRKSHTARKDAVLLRNVVEDRQDHEAISVEDTLGRRQPSDVYSGDVNLRTLRLLLKMIDNRGWER